jgi:flagellar biosynthesis protein FlhG
MSLTLLPSRPSPAFSIAVTSGKGGVGKTSVSINLAAALARMGRRVALFDADFALGNIDVRLGLTPASHLGDVLDGDRSLDEITMAGPFGIDVIPAANGVRELAALTSAQWARLTAALASAASGRDFLLVDTATGIGDTVIDLIGLSDYALVVTSHEPAALVDAYAVVKLLTAADHTKPIGVLVNAARDERQAAVVFRQLARASERFLGRTLRNDGYIIEDPGVRSGAFAAASLDQYEPGGPAGRCFARLAARLAAWRRPPNPGPGPASVLPLPMRRPVPSFAEALRCA